MVSYIPQQGKNQTLASAPPTQADNKRRQSMTLAWKAYRGELQDPLKIDKDQPNDNVKANRCSPIVDKGTSFLFGSVLKIECAASEQQQFVDALWGDDDDQMTLLCDMAMNGAICGTDYVKLIPSPDPGGCPRIVLLNPMLLRIISDPEDCTLVLAYIIEYPKSADMNKRQVIARVDPNSDLTTLGNADMKDTWTITTYVSKGNNENWYQVGEIEDWPYPFPPIFHCKNLPNPNEAYGTPDLTSDLIEMNKVLNFMLSNISRIIKYHGHPKTVITGIRSSAQIKTAPDEVLVLEAPDSKAEILAAMENFNGLLSVVADLRSDMDEQSRVCAVALGRLESLPKGNISGVALQLLFQPLIEKTTIKRRLYGRHIRDITRAALVLGGQISADQWLTYQVDLHWQNLLPVDDLAAAQTAVLLQQIGVSDSTVMQQLGYNADDEASKRQSEDAKKMVAYSRGQGMPPAQQVQQDSQMQQKVGMGNE